MRLRGGGATCNKPSERILGGCWSLREEQSRYRDLKILACGFPALETQEGESEFISGSVSLIAATGIDSCLRAYMSKKRCKSAFTMAEVLITLGIIGIIAAMTLPALIGKYQKIVTVNQLKKAYTVLSQMMIRSQEDNGPVYFNKNMTVDASEVKTFFNTYWLPYFNHPVVSKEGEKIYDNTIPVTTLAGEQYGVSIATIYGSGRIYFTTNDGTAYHVDIMEWGDIEYDDEGNTVSQTAYYASNQMVYVDLNGIKAPNVIGKDIFVFIIDFDNTTVSPWGYSKTTSEINSNCGKSGTGMYCAAKIMRDGWQIKSDYPW